MIIVGLDLSLTSAGIAVLVDGRPKVITHVGHTGRDGASYTQRSTRIVSQARAVMAALSPTNRYWDYRSINLAVIEGPSYGDNMPSNHDRAGLWWGVVSALLAKRIPIAVIAPSTLKLWWTGNGAASKLDMLNAAMVRVREPVSTSDEADALALAYAGAHHLGDPVPFELGERSIAALSKVEWPVSA